MLSCPHHVAKSLHTDTSGQNHIHSIVPFATGDTEMNIFVTVGGAWLCTS